MVGFKRFVQFAAVTLIGFSLMSVVNSQAFDTVMPVNGVMDYTGCPKEPLQNFTYSTVWRGRYDDTIPGRCEGSGWHPGVDIPLPEGTPIYAVADGTVHFSQRIGMQNPSSGGGWGAHLIIKHQASVPVTGIVYSIYAHLQSSTIPSDFSMGTPVKKGQFIGRSGNTGNTFPPSRGFHLHFQIDKDKGETHPYFLCGSPNDPPDPNNFCISDYTYNPVFFVKNRITWNISLSPGWNYLSNSSGSIVSLDTAEVQYLNVRSSIAPAVKANVVYNLVYEWVNGNGSTFDIRNGSFKPDRSYWVYAYVSDVNLTLFKFK